MSANPVVKQYAYLLVHTSDFVRYGSKPIREIPKSQELGPAITAHLRNFAQVVAYPPNQVFIGNLHPEDLAAWPEPWWQHPVEQASPVGKYGEIVDQETFYGYLKAADGFDLVYLTPGFTARVRERLQGHHLSIPEDMDNLGPGVEMDKIKHAIEAEGSLPLFHQDELIGSFQRHHDEDASLSAHVLMENLMTKASGAMVVRLLLERAGMTPEQGRYLISCSEEAVGDRYNRGGGSMAKAVGDMCRMVNSTGADTKAFCAGPIYALVHGGGLVKAEVFENLVVFGGGCLAKLGMKYSGHLKHDMPILEDVLGGIAFLLTPDDGVSPVLRLDAVGLHTVGAGSSQQEILKTLAVIPLEKLGLGLTTVDKISTELHNPEVTVPQGSGNVPLNNYKLLAALAIMRGEIKREELNEFIATRGMPGFSPTQGHVPAAVPYLGHAAEAMAQGRMNTALLMAKGSLFLGRMSQLSDGMSVLLERNPARKAGS
ncbi:MAG: glycine reductase [Desulfarculus sp.]|nr:MAG: glycine reductase [Desulfarculus sp.]